jgi:putative oxidoreductase
MTSGKGKGKRIAITTISILVGVVFLFAGGTKLAPGAMHAQNVEAFTRWGYAVWFIYAVGVIEVGGGLLLLIPAARFYAAALLACNMIGATITHLRAGEVAHAPTPLILALLCVWIANATRPSAFKAAPVAG